MQDRESWDWDTEKKVVADLAKLRKEVAEVHEMAVSPDGEHIAVPVVKEENDFALSLDGEVEERTWQRIRGLQYTADGRLFGLWCDDDVWKIHLDGALWEPEFEFAWNPKFSPDGKHVAVQIKQDMEYGIAVDGEVWEEKYLSIRDFALSDDGRKVAALVQAEELPEADIFKFLEGTWSVAVNGTTWDSRYLNVYCPTFSPDGEHVAVEVRTDPTTYTVAQDDKPWEARFGCVWEPVYRGKDHLIAPVRASGSWTLVEDGRELWRGQYIQLWYHTLSPDQKRIAAVVAPSYGRWTVAVDDTPWEVTFGDLVLAPVFSPDGQRVAAAAKDDDRWQVVVDGKVWPGTFDMAWDPVFTPDGAQVVAKVEVEGRYAYAVDGKVASTRYEALQDPVFSPDGKKVLVRAVQDGKYTRLVLPIAKLGG